MTNLEIEPSPCTAILFNVLVLLVTGYLFLVTGYWLFVAGYWALVGTGSFCFAAARPVDWALGGGRDLGRCSITSTGVLADF